MTGATTRHWIVIILLATCASVRTASQEVRAPFSFDVEGLQHRSPSAASPYCESLLNDLKSSDAVTFLRPLATFETLRNIEDEPPFGACSLEYLVQQVEMTYEQTRAVEGLPFEEQWFNGSRSLQTAEFKLFDVEFDGDTSNGREYLLYGAGNTKVYGTWSDRELGSRVDRSFITVPDTTTCRARFRVQVWDSVSSPGSVLGVAQHQGRSLIYDTRYWGNEGKSTLEFIQYVGPPSYTRAVCSYITDDLQVEP